MNRPPSAAGAKIAYLTAGAAGMYCGSCMHDNTLARALSRMGLDIELIPTYTPIRTDEIDVSVDRVFFGGINVYLQQKIPLFKHLPAFIDRCFDNPRLLRWVSSRAIEISPQELGSLTLSMLQGQSGSQRKEVRRLCRWLAEQSKPNLVVLSNMLIGGCIPAIKEKLRVPVLVTLQGDDIFLDELPAAARAAAVARIRDLVSYVDGFIVNSQYYADHMGQCFQIPSEKIHHVPLGIDTGGFPTATDMPWVSPATRQPTVGYLARLAPEKGLHVLVDAFLLLKRMRGLEKAQLKVAGWMGAHQQEYAEQQFDKLRAAGCDDSFEYLGEVDRAGKIELLRSIDVLSVPTTYQEPKGLYVLEALAAGVPVVQPEHGSFPELLNSLQGGRLVRPDDPVHLAESLADLLTNDEARRALAQKGHRLVHQQHNAEAMAVSAWEVYQRFLSPVSEG